MKSKMSIVFVFCAAISLVGCSSVSSKAAIDAIAKQLAAMPGQPEGYEIPEPPVVEKPPTVEEPTKVTAGGCQCVDCKCSCELSQETIDKIARAVVDLQELESTAKTAKAGEKQKSETGDTSYTVDMWTATWCQSCGQVNKSEFPPGVLNVIDYDQNAATGQALGVKLLPTFIVRRSGSEVVRIVGVTNWQSIRASADRAIQPRTQTRVFGNGDGDTYAHLLNDHGISATQLDGMTTDQLEQLHTSLHSAGSGSQRYYYSSTARRSGPIRNIMHTVFIRRR